MAKSKSKFPIRIDGTTIATIMLVLVTFLLSGATDSLNTTTESIALMCFEADKDYCHRGVISNALHAEVVHI